MAQPDTLTPQTRAKWNQWMAPRVKQWSALGMTHPTLEPLTEIVALAMMAKDKPKGKAGNPDVPE